PEGINYYYVEVTGACGGLQVSEVSGRYRVTPPLTEIISDLDTTPQTICPGDLFTDITVLADGANLTYQWYSNTSPSTNGGSLISGATNSDFTPPTEIF